jgi:SAM-dependent methyltransferase
MADLSTEFWRRMASQFGGPALVLCCGGGELAREIAAMGLSVTGVDRDAARIAQARDGGDDLDVRWIEADACRLALPRRFGLVVLTGDAFQGFLARGEQVDLLASVRRHLAPEGGFGFDMDQRAGHSLADDVEHLLEMAGFEIGVQYGDWDFGRVRRGSERLITLCRLKGAA